MYSSPRIGAGLLNVFLLFGQYMILANIETILFEMRKDVVNPGNNLGIT